MQKIIWSTEQAAMIEHARNGSGNMAGQARAGTGKSSVGIGMIEVAPESSVLYVQFNKRNQLEMSARINDPRCLVSTFHSEVGKFLREKWGHCKAVNFWAEANRINDFDKSCKGIPLNQIAKLVSHCKNECITIPTTEQAEKIAVEYGIEDCDKHGYPLDKIVEMTIKVLVASLERPRTGQISFDDMIWVPVVNGWLKPRYSLAIGDEAQDFNNVQQDALTKLSSGRTFILGDDRQQIYSWRGAVDNGFDILTKKLDAKVFPLTVTRRCPKLVVEKAQSLVPDFKAHDSAPLGEINNRTFDEMIKQTKLGDAILSRKNAPLMSTCLDFIRKGITARIEGRDIAAQLEQVVKQVGGNDIMSFLDNLEAWKMARVSKAKGFNAQNTIEYVCDQADTIKVLAETCSSVSDVSNKLVLLFEDTDGQKKPCVKLSSIHKAKGLEWSTVNTLVDSHTVRKSATAKASREEENLHYVCWTRSKHTLNMVSGLTTTPQP